MFYARGFVDITVEKGDNNPFTLRLQLISDNGRGGGFGSGGGNGGGEGISETLHIPMYGEIGKNLRAIPASDVKRQEPAFLTPPIQKKELQITMGTPGL